VFSSSAKTNLSVFHFNIFQFVAQEMLSTSDRSAILSPVIQVKYHSNVQGVQVTYHAKE